jgi:hypothetical protein
VNVLEQLVATRQLPPPEDPWPDEPVTELVTEVRSLPPGLPLLACFARRTYALRAGRLSLADEQAPLLPISVSYTDPTTGEVHLHDDTDLLAPKAATDVVVTGSACSGKPVAELMIAVAAGASVRRLRVVGPRVADVGRDGTVTFSDPVPFEETELSPRLAYGGGDLAAQNLRERRGDTLLADLPADERPTRAEWIYAYPRNPVGLGYFIDEDRQRASGALLPRIEDPADPLTPERLFLPTPQRWLDAPIPGLLGWVAPDWYPRCARVAGVVPPHEGPARPERESTFPDGADLPGIRASRAFAVHPRALSGAAPGLAAERLRGDEAVLLENLRPGEPSVRFDLPGEAPSFRMAPPGLKELSPSPLLQTVRIDAAAGTVSLTWCAAVKLGARVPVGFLQATRLHVSWRKV